MVVHSRQFLPFGEFRPGAEPLSTATGCANSRLGQTWDATAGFEASSGLCQRFASNFPSYFSLIKEV